MNQVLAAVNLGIAGYYSLTILWHLVKPGDNIGYTRMLMFACLATIPLAFMLAMIGGRDRWPLLLGHMRDIAGQGPLSLMLIMGFAVLLVVLPCGLLIGVWFGMGFKFGSMFLVYFVPVLVRMVTKSARESIETAVIQGVLLFACFFIGIGIVWLLTRLPVGVISYEQHLQKIWPDYGDAAKVFFSVCVFALINQLLEGRHAVLALIGKQ